MEIEKMLIALKNLVRTGWMQKGIPGSEGETVAEHCFESAVLAYVIGLKLKEKGIQVNPERASTIALFHDAGESLLGDFPKWASERIDKYSAELDAFKSLGIGEDLFIEYKKTITLEGKIARLSDRLSTYLQTKRYSKKGYDVSEIGDSYAVEIRNFLNSEPFILLGDLWKSIGVYNFLQNEKTG
ncbi:phosphohydrolase [Candidatus Acidianus copahuensis]|uniref:5'-deoxynucleotidase n=1 Tax=Candidatus Acidianus copahuensis TaxID=1160895 RepID=A0A031LSK7_9CREN|nr:HD family hydrolase [Candidatus Acidianus copahuensis]EZQ10806.1 phosphohydrolase [Candidatus Acidianus copahuensis]